MTIRQWVSRNFLQLLIISGFIIFGLQWCSNKNNIQNPRNFSDTIHNVVYEKHDTLIISKPQLINTYHTITKTDSIYQASNNKDSLLQQYKNVVDSLLAYNIYKNSYKVDSLGDLEVIDSVHKNNIIGQSIKYNLSIPVKTTIINNHIFEKSKAQFFIGANLEGSQSDILQGVGIGTIYKSKRNQVWQLSAQYNFKNGVTYQLGRYFPIKLRK